MKLRTLLLTAVLTAAMSVACLAQDINVSLNGSIISFPNQKPVVVDGRTLIPLRGVFDNMGYNIGWNGNTKTVTLTKNGSTIVINIGESFYYLNDKPVAIDVPAQIINGSTMLPLRAIADATGCEVLWDSDSKIATIIDNSSISLTPKESVVITQSQQEADYIDSYTAIISQYNTTAIEFASLCQELNANGFSDDSQTTKLVNLAQQLYTASLDAKNKISALSCPSKFAELNRVSVEYVQAMADVSKLYVDLANGDITLADFEQKYNTVGTNAMLKEAEYQRVFSEIE
jgi:hypothetical protein